MSETWKQTYFQRTCTHLNSSITAVHKKLKKKNVFLLTHRLNSFTVTKPTNSSPVHDSSVDGFQDDDLLSAVLQKVRHLLFQRWFHLVLRDDFQMIPRCFAAPFHLSQVLLQLIEIHLNMKSNLTVTRTGSVCVLSRTFDRHVLCVHTRVCFIKKICESVSYFGRARQRSDLRVKITALGKVLHHDTADVMQERLFVYGVLHFWNFLQIVQIKSFSLWRRKPCGHYNIHTSVHVCMRVRISRLSRSESCRWRAAWTQCIAAFYSSPADPCPPSGPVGAQQLPANTANVT